MNDKPIAFIKEQPLTDTPTTGDNTLVDDPVALVDDSTALVGGPNTITENIKTSVKEAKTITKIPRNS